MPGAGRQQIAAEIAVEVAPDGVAVVRAVLDVVVLDDEVRRLDPVVVRRTGVGGTDPGEVDRVAGRFDLGATLLGQVRRHVAGVLLDQRVEQFALFGPERARGQALSFFGRHSRLVRGEDVAGRFVADHGLLALVVVEGLEQRAGEVLLATQGAQSLARAARNTVRVGAEEQGRGGGRLAGDDGEVERYVVSLEAPAPVAVLAWFTEERHVVAERIPHRREAVGAGRFLEPAQYGLQAHDGGRLAVAPAAERGAEQGVEQVMLVGTHVQHRKPFSLLRDEVPVDAFGGVEVEHDGRALLVAQGGEQVVRRRGHRVGGLVVAGGTEESGRAGAAQGDQQHACGHRMSPAVLGAGGVGLARSLPVRTFQRIAHRRRCAGWEFATSIAR